MATIILTRGIQGSGKTTWAKKYAETHQQTVHVCRDDIRYNVFGKYHGVDEDAVTEIETAMVRAALRSNKDVVVDATHLQQRYINRWQRLGYPVEVVEFPVDLDTLLYNNANRDRQVPEAVIEKNFKLFTTGPTGYLKPVTLTPEQYVTAKFEPYDTFRDTWLPEAYIFDIDGTLAHNNGHRSFYDYSKVSDDSVHYHVSGVANSVGHDHYVIVVSGRKAEARKDTEDWLKNNWIHYDHLYMREDGDDRPDAIVKYEILRYQIAPLYDVIGAFDDRPSVLRMWQKVGIPTFAVGDPWTEF